MAILYLNLILRQSKLRSKRNLAILGEPMPLAETKALTKDVEKEPFYPNKNLAEEINLKWERKFMSRI